MNDIRIQRKMFLVLQMGSTRVCVNEAGYSVCREERERAVWGIK
jgi:hypothetical protein